MTEIIRMVPSEAGLWRLKRLSKGCNRVLATASVVGREFDFRLLSALSEEIIEASLLELVDEALAAHVIEELPEARERYQFSHALIQETLSEESSTSRRVRLHARPSNGFTCHLPPWWHWKDRSGGPSPIIMAVSQLIRRLGTCWPGLRRYPAPIWRRCASECTCRDVGVDCDWRTSGATEDEVMASISEHAR